MVIAVNRLELDWKLLNGMSQHYFLILNIAIPSKAIDVDQAPLAGSGCEGFFIAGDGIVFAFGK